MIQSMTGYGKSTAVVKGKKIHVEIKSLNSKALDLSARIVPLYREKEMEIRAMISRTLERGKVDFTIWVEKTTRKRLHLSTALSWTTITSRLNKSVKNAIFPFRPTGSPRYCACRTS